VPELARIWEDATCEVHRMVVGPMDNNVYIVRCRRSGDALLIDAANEHEALLEVCERLGVRRVVETHGHWDHIQAVPAVRDAGISVSVTSEDAGMLPSYDLLLADDDVIELGRLRVRTLLTPGHTAGSICFDVEGTPLLFTGDTLFPGGPGATSFEGGDFPTIIRSIEDRIFSRFDPATIVLPGHGASTGVDHGGLGVAPPPGVDRPGLVAPKFHHRRR
jgi:glyoxylase-like metal-dependent hydrolase (beta-lactamase superfamily II)